MARIRNPSAEKTERDQKINAAIDLASQQSGPLSKKSILIRGEHAISALTANQPKTLIATRKKSPKNEHGNALNPRTKPTALELALTKVGLVKSRREIRGARHFFINIASCRPYNPYLSHNSLHSSQWRPIIFGSHIYKNIALLLASTLAAATPVIAQDRLPDGYVFTQAEQEEIAACFAQHKGALYAYAGLNLTPQQIANYTVILESVGTRIGKINENTPLKKLTYGGLAASIREGTSEVDSASVTKAIDAVQHLPTAEQIRLLTASHGKYAEFDDGSYADYSDAQIAASNVLGAEYESRMAAMMTPAQQTKFRSNLASINQYMACEKSSPPSTYSIQWFMGNFGDEGPKF